MTTNKIKSTRLAKKSDQQKILESKEPKNNTTP